MQTGHCPWGQLLEAEDWSSDQGVPQVEDLPQEEGEFSLEYLNRFHSTHCIGKCTIIRQYFIYLSESSQPKKETFGHMSFVFAL